MKQTNTEEIIAILQEDISQILSTMEKRTIKSDIEKIELILKYGKLSIFQTLTNEMVKTKRTIEEVTPINEEEIENKEQEEQEEIHIPTFDNTFFHFSRRLKGGEILADGVLLTGDVYVSESVIRRFDLRHNDILRLMPKEEVGEHTFPYTLEIIGNDEEKAPTNFHEVEYAVVQLDYETNEYYINADINNQPIGIDEEDEYVIPEKLVQSFDLQSGDIVSLVYQADDFESCVLRWKHNLREDEVNEPTEHYRMRNFEGQGTNVEDEEVDEEKVPRTDLQGLNILMVGMSQSRNQFVEFIKENNGELHYHDAKSGKKWRKILEQAIKRADCVIIGQRQISHSSSYATVEFAKKYAKPFGVLNTYGRGSLLLAIQEAMEKAVA